MSKKKKKRSIEYSKGSVYLLLAKGFIKEKERVFELSISRDKVDCRSTVVGGYLKKKKRIGIVWQIMNVQCIKYIKESNGKLLKEGT